MLSNWVAEAVFGQTTEAAEAQESPVGASAQASKPGHVGQQTNASGKSRQLKVVQ